MSNRSDNWVHWVTPNTLLGDLFLEHHHAMLKVRGFDRLPVHLPQPAEACLSQ
jgi:hypothetical protein